MVRGVVRPAGREEEIGMIAAHAESCRHDQTGPNLESREGGSGDRLGDGLIIKLLLDFSRASPLEHEPCAPARRSAHIQAAARGGCAHTDMRIAHRTVRGERPTFRSAC